MKNTKVTLAPLEESDREQFILDNQWAFKFGALQEFGKRDDHVDFDGEIISRRTIEECIDAPENETYRILLDGKKVGGMVLKIDKETNYNHLELLFTDPTEHSKGIGFGAWQQAEALRRVLPQPEVLPLRLCQLPQHPVQQVRSRLQERFPRSAPLPHKQNYNLPPLRRQTWTGGLPSARPAAQKGFF